MSHYTFRCMLGIGVALLALLSPAFFCPSSVHAQEPRSLAFFETGSGTINDDTPAETWTFDGMADQAVSLVAVGTSGDLDPVLELLGPGGDVIQENDDLDSLVRDAGVEGFTLPEDGPYTVRVSRYGTTSGAYDLSLTPGFARVVRRETFDSEDTPWLSAESASSVSLAQGRLQVQVIPSGTMQTAIPTDAELLKDIYFQASAKPYGQVSYAEFGLIFRQQGVTNAQQAYQFKVNTEGKWTVLLQDISGQFALQTWTSNTALDSTEWTLAVLARENTLSFYGNGALLGTLTDERLTTPGRVGLLVSTRGGQADPATVNFDNVIVTTRMGSTYHGLPLALTNWDSPDPGRIKDELLASGQINPVRDRDLYVADALLSSIDQETQFHLLGTTQTAYTDFLFGVTMNMSTNGESIACGMVYRWQDEANLDVAYVDTAGGFGLVQTRDSALTTNVYDLKNRAVLADGPNRLLVIARGDRVALYINGALATEETVQPGTGRVGVTLLNYEDTATDCFWGDMWVWPLLSEE